jgi:membrane protein DedA with SNARE-associated domain
MEDFLSDIPEMAPFWAYIFLFLSAYIENVFPPIPGDTVTVFGAYLVGTGSLKFWYVLFATTLGSVMGFMTVFGLAYWLEWKVIEKYQFRWISKTRLDQVENWFSKYGYWIILFNRFFSGGRSVISFVAGLSKMRTLYVFNLALLSCIVWNTGLIYLGSTIGKNWQEIIKMIKLYNRIVFAILVLLVFIYTLYYILRRKQKSV